MVTAEDVERNRRARRLPNTTGGGIGSLIATSNVFFLNFSKVFSQVGDPREAPREKASVPPMALTAAPRAH